MEFMDKLIELIFSGFKNENYEKIILSVLLGLALFAPSYSYIFLYHRESFYRMDFLKLLFLSIMLNLIFFIVIYGYNFLIYEIKLKKKMKVLSENISEIEKAITNGLVLNDFVDDKTVDSCEYNNMLEEKKIDDKKNIFINSIASMLVTLFLMYFYFILKIILPFSFNNMEEFFLITLLFIVISSNFSILKEYFKFKRDIEYVFIGLIFICSIMVLFVNAYFYFIK